MHYFVQILRAMFDKLAHASIMRMNESSMDKLYNLMTMAVKYQVDLLIYIMQVFSAFPFHASIHILQFLQVSRQGWL